PLTHRCLLAERALMRSLEGGCQVPIGGFAHCEGDTMILDSIVASLDGKEILIEQMTGPKADAEKMGIASAKKLIERGADRILKDIRGD
ncbi:MAG: hydroxymethylbilane synthase, partial [Spirochaetota bacterium]|nr:hydroxymethylbilane synthase [Spirochaetota bacterium]